MIPSTSLSPAISFQHRREAMKIARSRASVPYRMAIQALMSEILACSMRHPSRGGDVEQSHGRCFETKRCYFWRGGQCLAWPRVLRAFISSGDREVETALDHFFLRWVAERQPLRHEPAPLRGVGGYVPTRPPLCGRSVEVESKSGKKEGSAEQIIFRGRIKLWI